MLDNILVNQIRAREGLVNKECVYILKIRCKDLKIPDYYQEENK